jgi:hypothetical protein
MQAHRAGTQLRVFIRAAVWKTAALLPFNKLEVCCYNGLCNRLCSGVQRSWKPSSWALKGNAAGPSVFTRRGWLVSSQSSYHGLANRRTLEADSIRQWKHLQITAIPTRQEVSGRRNQVRPVTHENRPAPTSC